MDLNFENKRNTITGAAKDMEISINLNYWLFFQKNKIFL
jgi:hypothetical protein